MIIQTKTLLQAKQVLAVLGGKSGLDPKLITWTARNINAIEVAIAEYSQAEEMLRHNYDNSLKSAVTEEDKQKLAVGLNWALVTLQKDQVDFAPVSVRSLSWLLPLSEMLELSGIQLSFLLTAGLIIDDIED